MSRRIDIFIPDLRGGGAERVAVHLANALASLHRDVRLLTLSSIGPNAARVSNQVRLEQIGSRRMATAIPGLVSAFRRDRPDAIISHITHGNVACLGAAAISGLMRRTIVVEHNQFDRITAGPKGRALRLAYALVPWAYRGAGAVVSVSNGVGRRFNDITGLNHPNQITIANPVITDDLPIRMRRPSLHPWLEDRRPTDRPPGAAVPVIVTVGALTTQKDHATLFRALRRLTDLRKPGSPAPRLIVYGEGPLRGALQALRDELCLAGRIDMPGYVNDPFPAIARADLFAMSSRWEGLPTALIEALGCGANCVSSNCESGPADILNTSRIGRLCPPGDPGALANTMAEALDRPTDPSTAMARARDFSVDTAARNYAELCDRLITSPPGLLSLAGSPLTRSRRQSG